MIKINLYVDEQAWRAFRVACLHHNVSASQEVTKFLRARLREWQQAEAEEARPPQARAKARKYAQEG